MSVQFLYKVYEWLTAGLIFVAMFFPNALANITTDIPAGIW